MFKAEQLFVADNSRALKCMRRPGVVHDQVFLEAIPIEEICHVTPF